MNTSPLTTISTTLPITLKNDSKSLLLRALMIVAGSLLLWASAKFHVPFYPVPMTMQTWVVVMLGLIMGPYTATAAVIAYLGYGAFGLPVFSGTPEKGIGLTYMTGPTGGYLLGFILASFVAGYLAVKPFARNIAAFIAIALLSIAIVYIPGILWLSILIGFDNAVQYGILPFLPGDAVKAVLAAVIAAGLLKFKLKEQ